MKLNQRVKEVILLVLVSIFVISCDANEEMIPLKASFESTYTIDQNKAIVSLVNTSIGAITYEWSFIGATTENSNEHSPVIEYINNGTYLVTLVASNETENSTKTVELVIEGITENVDDSNDDDSEAENCVLTTACSTVNLTGTPGYSISSVVNTNGGYDITVTDSLGEVVYEENCATNGSISIDCGN